MPTSTPLLAQQIQRLMLKKEDMDRLLNELKGMSDIQLQHMAELIRDHDEEALKILNEKVGEQESSKRLISDQAPGEKPKIGKEEVVTFFKMMENIFRHPDKLAKFLAMSDDFFLSKLEAVIHEGLKASPESQVEFDRFFHEARLQKAAFKKEQEEEQQKALAQDVERMRTQSEELQALIDDAKKVLENQGS
ncbi:MAG: hypothetical protein Q8O95_05095 [bacterium]|nr:hypothetical protein [bacterium]